VGAGGDRYCGHISISALRVVVVRFDLPTAQPRAIVGKQIRQKISKSSPVGGFAAS
jgi:hypothetical protein